MDEDDVRESEDDALEDTRAGGMFHPESDEEKLPEDNSPPAAPPSGSSDDIPPDHPITDDNLDTDEIYSEGLSVATDEDKVQEDSDDHPAQPLEPEA